MKLETVIDQILSAYPEPTRFQVVAHELWGNRREGYETNSSWYLSRDADRETVTEIARGRWEVFKVNYLPKARVRDIDVAGEGAPYAALLECSQIPWLDIVPIDPPAFVPSAEIAA